MRLLFCNYLLCININIMSLSQTTENNSITVPHHNTLQHASMVSIKDDKQANIVKETMENAVPLKVPNKVNYKKGKNWGSIK